MPRDEAAAQDPLELVGVSLPGDCESVREMAATFAEEFAAMGFGEERLRQLFRTPRYAGAHRAWQLLGDEEVDRIIAENVAAFGGVRFVVKDAARRGGNRKGRRVALPVVPSADGSKEI